MPRNDVQLPQDSEKAHDRERDDDAVGESRVNVRAEEQRERRNADRAGDAVQRLHFDH